MKDNTIVEEFLNYLKFEKRFSEHTAKCYGADLTQFGEFLTGTHEAHAPDSGLTSMSHDGTATAVATMPQTDQLVL